MDKRIIIRLLRVNILTSSERKQKENKNKRENIWRIEIKDVSLQKNKTLWL